LPAGVPAEEAAVLLTGCGLEVEGSETYQSVKGGLSGLFIGEVKTCQRHPNADKLSLTTVDVGGEQPLQIVCGAPNVASGQKVVVAVVGTTVYPVSGEPFEIRKSKIRGELSEGMICAEDEIGLGASHAGILVLPDDAPVGTPVKDYFNVQDDTVLEIGLTPNRVDAASHIGVARDLAALLSLKSGFRNRHTPVIPDVAPFNRHTNGKVTKVEVQDAVACPRYSGVTIESVTVADSPDWLQHRLKAIGVSPINNIVDITNYVLHECGQPLHAFDADRISGGKVVVRMARPGERFVTLDAVERELLSSDLVICDEKHPMCIAGVYGGLDSGISASTNTVFLESAYFQPSCIRKTSKHHGLKTDASFRFERGADPSATLYALKRAALLICELAGGKISSDILDHYPVPVVPARVDFRFDYLDRFSGHAIDRNTVCEILLSLGMQLESRTNDGCTVIVPTAKVDVTRPIDLVEEILRIYGYDNVPLPEKLAFSLPSGAGSETEALQNKSARFLAGNGFNELFTNSLTRAAYRDSAGNDPSTTVALLNPLSQDLGVLRQDLLHTGLEAIQYNRNRRHSDLRLFEFGKSYQLSGTGYEERRHLVLFLTGNRTDESWNSDAEPVDYFLMKAFVERLLLQCGIPSEKLSGNPDRHEALSSCYSLMLGQKRIAYFGPVRKSLLRKFDIQSDALFADVDWDLVIRSVRKKNLTVSEIPRFPQVRRDLSMVIGKEVEFAKIEQLAFRTEKKLLREVRLFDVFEGEKIGSGKKSYAVSFLLQDDQQTLTDQQIDKVMERMMNAFEKEVGAVIRKA
jgi:phenylalanyl-tRNA synthetase beta chain